MAILVPLEDDLLAEDLSLVEEEHDLVETLQEALVVITIFLDLVTQNHFTLSRAGESGKQRNVILQMPQNL